MKKSEKAYLGTENLVKLVIVPLIEGSRDKKADTAKQADTAQPQSEKTQASKFDKLLDHFATEFKRLNSDKQTRDDNTLDRKLAQWLATKTGQPIRESTMIRLRWLLYHLNNESDWHTNLTGKWLDVQWLNQAPPRVVRGVLRHKFYTYSALLVETIVALKLSTQPLTSVGLKIPEPKMVQPELPVAAAPVAKPKQATDMDLLVNRVEAFGNYLKDLESKIKRLEDLSKCADKMIDLAGRIGVAVSNLEKAFEHPAPVGTAPALPDWWSSSTPGQPIPSPTRTADPFAAQDPYTPASGVPTRWGALTDEAKAEKH